MKKHEHTKRKQHVASTINGRRKYKRRNFRRPRKQSNSKVRKTKKVRACKKNILQVQKKQIRDDGDCYCGDDERV